MTENQNLPAWCGIEGLDEAFGERFAFWLAREEAASAGIDGQQANPPILPEPLLRELEETYRIPASRIAVLRDAAADIESDKRLYWVTRFLISDMCTDRNRYDAGKFNNPTPTVSLRHAALYPLVLMLGCVPVSRRNCAERGIPESLYLPVADRALKNQMALFAEGDAHIADFPWDMNFYTGVIFLLDRFYFIAVPYEDEVDFWRNRRMGSVVGLMTKETAFRRDGQYDGLNTVHDRDAFASQYRETKESVTANPVNPAGFLERETVVLNRAEWQRVLHRGDMVLGFHIPSGPGYEPERFRISSVMALDFFRSYFPEWDIKGIWSESWLYDPRLSLFLDADRSNIARMQRQMYLYPMDWGDGMLKYELFGSESVDVNTFEPKTGLQRQAVAYMRAGGRFGTGGMVVLKEETDRIGGNPYSDSADWERFLEVVDSHLDTLRPHRMI